MKHDLNYLKDKLKSFQWYCRINDTICSFMVTFLSITTVAMFTLLVVK